MFNPFGWDLHLNHQLLALVGILSAPQNVSKNLTTKVRLALPPLLKHTVLHRTRSRWVSLNFVGYFRPNPSSRSMPMCAAHTSASAVAVRWEASVPAAKRIPGAVTV